MQATTSAEVGQSAPEFKLKGPGGQWVSLSEFRGKKNVILVFYPLAFSPVCTHQLPELEKEMPRLRALDAEVLGISVDSHYANEAYAQKLRLSFPLLGDFRREVSTAYGVLNPDTLYSNRTLFVVDKQGTIVHRQQTPTNADLPDNERMIAALESLRSL
jgi:peroxiredoxin (alkyl hydroperoxide reductase subunit C)